MVGKSEDAGSERKAAIDGFDRRGGLRRWCSLQGGARSIDGGFFLGGLDEDWRRKQTKKKDAFFLG